MKQYILHVNWKDFIEGLFERLIEGLFAGVFEELFEGVFEEVLGLFKGIFLIDIIVQNELDYSLDLVEY